jgi:hypothetical protein
MRSLWGLSQAIERADKTLIFTQTISTAKEVAGIVSAAGPRAAAAHSKLKPAERAAVLAAFGAGELDVLVAPRILDEGIDVPAADLGIIVSASRTRRQMIQRMGRVLRRKGDGRLARFVILYVEHTIEDPKRGTHEEFLEEVTGPAEAVQAFSVGAPLAAIVAYLDDFENPAGQPPALMEGDAPTTLVVSPVDLVEYTGPFEDPCFMLAGDSVRVELAAKVAALSDERRQLWELLEFVLRLTCESERPKLLPSWSEATRAVFRFEDDEDDDDVESLADLFDLVYETLNLFDFDNRTTLWKAFLAAHPESEATEFAAFLESLPALLDLEIEDACWVVEFGSATRAAHGGLDVALGPEP